MKLVLAAALAAALAIPAGARAHGAGGIHARGKVKAISAEQVTLTTREGDRTFALRADTAVLRGTEAVRPADVQAGERAVIHAQRDGEKLRATEIRLAPAQAAPQKDRQR